MTPTERIEEFGGEIHADLAEFFTGKYARYQGAGLEGLAYLSPLYVDLDGSLSAGWEATLEMMEDQGLDADARETVDVDGREYTPIAWLFADTDDDEPEAAYVIADVSDPGAPVYLADPSGEPELIADSFDAFLACLAL